MAKYDLFGNQTQLIELFPLLQRFRMVLRTVQLRCRTYGAL